MLNRKQCVMIMFMVLIMGYAQLAAKRSCHCQPKKRKVWGYVDWNKLHSIKKSKRKKNIVTQESAPKINTSTFDDRKGSQGAGKIKKIYLWHGNVLSALQVVYRKKMLPAHPINGGDPTTIISIPKNNPLVSIYGVYGKYFGAQHFAQVFFVLRDGQMFGPFGDGNYMETPTSAFSLGTDKEIFAFFGGSYRHTDESEFLSSLGIYMRHRS